MFTNTGGHTSPAAASKLDNDVYRLSVASSDRGWTAQLDNALTTATAGRTVSVPVYVLRDPDAARTTTATLTARSESNPAITRSFTCTVDVGDTVRR
ncbi:MAG: hypothetical protein ABIQ18_41175 [Umezawaea sp.]